MRSNVKISVEIKPVKNPDGTVKIKATVPVGIVLQKSFDAGLFERELAQVEQMYLNLVAEVRTLMETIRNRKQKEGKVLLYWEIGNRIITFTKESELSNFYISKLPGSLARDTGISERVISRCRRFRLRFPEKTKIDSSRSFDSYVAEFERGYRGKEILKILIKS